MTRRFKKGEDLAQFVKQQINVNIKVDETFKAKRNWVYMELPDNAPLKSFLCEYGIKADKHLGNKYFVTLN